MKVKKAEVVSSKIELVDDDEGSLVVLRFRTTIRYNTFYFQPETFILLVHIFAGTVIN